MKAIRTLLLAAIFAATMMTISACNTTKGLGKDIERTGEKMQDKAD